MATRRSRKWATARVTMHDGYVLYYSAMTTDLLKFGDAIIGNIHGAKYTDTRLGLYTNDEQWKATPYVC